MSNNWIVVVCEEFYTTTGGRLDALDVTEDVAGVVSASGIRRGTALVFSPHTTCSVYIAEPSDHTIKALHDRMQSIAPDGAYYAHDDLEVRTENLVADEPANAPAHIFHVIAGRPSECIPIDDGRLVLGNGQRVLFVELDSARDRRYVVQVVGE